MRSILHDYKNEIKAMLLSNTSTRTIAKHYNVTIGVIAGFIRRELKDVNVIAKPKKQIKKEVYMPMLIEFEAEQCKFLAGNRPYIQCKHDRIIESPYCREHHDICYLKNTKNIKVAYKNWGQK
jgi:hypothetical protein